MSRRDRAEQERALIKGMGPIYAQAVSSWSASLDFSARRRAKDGWNEMLGFETEQQVPTQVKVPLVDVEIKAPSVRREMDVEDWK